MVLFGPWNGPFRKVKWCFLQSGELVLEHKALLFNGLRKAFIIRVFAVEGESARKYALIFWGIVGNWDGKSEMWLQFESVADWGHSGRRGWRLLGSGNVVGLLELDSVGGYWGKTVVYCFVVEQTLYYYWDYKGGRSAGTNSGEQGLYDLWGRLLFDISS